ncbi:MAG: bifunctional molybdenum cofactor biosynthesis protein MoaC/MoaB [Cytophagaceae bacterium]|nr:bifunctional molybdenum cofactor biosynthesis protein MoaC/MoaB [Cytophagaceae bacterium]MDW8455397.1 bifunctional molybdenum cofactor biosynthesis protein MoaC/MoaB [Cytophagaceae bacterium]
MINISHKHTTLRTAIAQALVKLSNAEAMQALLENNVPKGDVPATAKIAGLYAAKRTYDTIPHCHPLPIEYADIRLSTDGLTICIESEIHTIYKTGVEVEAMHAAAVAALTVYDMLKPLDDKIEIQSIRLLKKTGGKGDFLKNISPSLQAVVVVCSDAVYNGKKTDSAGVAVKDVLQKHKVNIKHYFIIPDDKKEIEQVVKKYAQPGIHMIIIAGGTGLTPRDQTPEALIPLLDKTIPGMEEAMRAYGQQRTPHSMVSRSVCGLTGNTLILAIPGSTRGAKESMDALFPYVLHLFNETQKT